MTNCDIELGRSDLRKIGLLLVNGFALMSYASIIEPFRAANKLAGRELYRWTHVSLAGSPAVASNGASIVASAKVGDALACDTLFVFAAGDPSSFCDAATFAWLRQLSSRGVTLAGVSGGPFLLARAGLLGGYRATIHWEHEPALREAFPFLDLDASLYVIDRQRLTCAGGTAGLDLAIELIERDHGHALAAGVGDWFIRTSARRADRSQRLGLAERYRVNHEGVLQALAAMHTHAEDPLDRPTLAATAGVSIRQLERLFLRYVGETVGKTYLRIRLDHADQLLRTTGLSVTAVAVSSGFAGSSQFSRAFRRQFGYPPSRASLEARRS
ncbi:GlxA family transcriptional regulator [Sphingomonas bacterium]|uniref:GlxA family transcriptional regulator n=1 Tax=Sphingomonas bacterium TaxID=1895847 RepID=UPI001576E996|nr:GlxA family transcriptional regulator [Sphingomonas bacterium]